MPRPKNYATATDRRTATQFIVACEGEKTEEIYLAFMTDELRRVNLLVLPTGQSGESAPRHLLERIKDEQTQLGATQSAQFWMVLDVDHHFSGRHALATHDVLSEAARLGIRVAISNPRFELWLLLHLEDVATCPSNYCETRLKALLGAYRHNSYNPRPLKKGLGATIERATKLDITPQSRVPALPGTQLYRLMTTIIEA